MTIQTITLFVFAYLFGSINFAIILFRLLGKGDPRGRFSGNPGTSNVYRQAGPLWALVVLLLDLGRGGMIAAVALKTLPPVFVTWIGLALILGNLFPCFHQYRGGKGVANFLGFSLVITPLVTLVSMVGWAMGFAFTRTPFIGSFLMVFIQVVGIIIAFWGNLPAHAGVIITAGVICYAHKQNVMEKFIKANGS